MIFLPKSFPNPDCLNPPKGTPTSVLLYVFTNTVPASTFSANRKALDKSLVKTPEAKPYSVALDLFSTPSISLKLRIKQLEKNNET